jgi:hypothetical protein
VPTPRLAARERLDVLPPVRVTDLKVAEKEGHLLRHPRWANRARLVGVRAEANTINGKVT